MERRVGMDTREGRECMGGKRRWEVAGMEGCKDEDAMGVRRGK